MGMVGASTVIFPSFRVHFSVALGACSLWIMATGSPLYASEHFWLDFRGETRLALTDNSLLTIKDRIPDLVLNTSPGFNMRWESKRVRAGIDYALDHLYFISDNSTDFRHSGFATIDAEVVKDHLSINGRASLRQQFLDQRGSISNSFANKTDNRRLIQNYTGSAILKGGLRDVADYRLTYRYGLTRTPADNLDDTSLPVNFSDTDSSEIVASIGSGNRFNSFSWRIYADSSRVMRSLEVNDFKNEHVAGELTYKFNRFIQVFGSAGFSRNNFQADVLSEDGQTWDAGFRWTPGRKLDLTISFGKEGKREEWYANLQYFFSPRYDFNGTYQDTLSANTIVTNDSLQGFTFDAEQGISNASGLPIDETDPIFTYSDVDFRRRTARGTFTLRQKRTTLFATANMEWRTFDDSTGTAVSWGVSSGFDRKITARTSLDGSISFRQSRFEGQIRIDNYIEANLDWTTKLSRYFRAVIGLSHSERQSNESGADLEENAVTLYLRGTF